MSQVSHPNTHLAKSIDVISSGSSILGLSPSSPKIRKLSGTVRPECELKCKNEQLGAGMRSYRSGQERKRLYSAGTLSTSELMDSAEKNLLWGN